MIGFHECGVSGFETRFDVRRLRDAPGPKSRYNNPATRPAWGFRAVREAAIATEAASVPRRGDHPRKRRTREHVIAAQSESFVEWFIVQCGYTCGTVRNDYGYDLAMVTFDDDGYAERGLVFFQLKATDLPLRTARGIAFDLDVRDYNLWIGEPMPVFLVVYDASTEQAYWLYLQQYFGSDRARRPAAGAKTIRVHLPESNRVGLDFVRYARDRKNVVLRQLSRRINHDG